MTTRSQQSYNRFIFVSSKKLHSTALRLQFIYLQNLYWQQDQKIFYSKQKMAQRYVLNSLNINNLTSINNSMLSQGRGCQPSPKRDLGSSVHSLSKTKSPTRLSSKSAKDPHKMIPVPKYEELVSHYNDLVKAHKALKIDRDQFHHAYNQLKIIAERQKSQLCQAFQDLKTNYIQLQGRYQHMTQTNSHREVASSIQKISSQVQEPQSSIYTLKQQYNILFSDNRKIKSQLESLQNHLQSTQSSLDRCLKEKYELEKQLQKITNQNESKIGEKQMTQQEMRRQLHRQSEQRFTLGLNSDKNLRKPITKISILMEENLNLILWKQNLQIYYMREKTQLNDQLRELDKLSTSQREQLIEKENVIEQLQISLQNATSQKQRMQQRSNIIQNQMGKIRAESNEVKEKASQQYKEKIAQILDKAFSLKN